MDPRQRNPMGQFANAIASSPDAMRKAYGLAPTIKGTPLLDLLRSKKGIQMPKQTPVLPKAFTARLDRVFEFARNEIDRKARGINRDIADLSYEQDRKYHTKRGALVGALGGAAALGGLSHVAKESPGMQAVSAAMGGLAGATTGVLVGSRIRKSNPDRYSREKRDEYRRRLGV